MRQTEVITLGTREQEELIKSVRRLTADYKVGAILLKKHMSLDEVNPTQSSLSGNRVDPVETAAFAKIADQLRDVFGLNYALIALHHPFTGGGNGWHYQPAGTDQCVRLNAWLARQGEVDFHYARVDPDNPPSPLQTGGLSDRYVAKHAYALPVSVSTGPGDVALFIDKPNMDQTITGPSTFHKTEVTSDYRLSAQYEILLSNDLADLPTYNGAGWLVGPGPGVLDPRLYRSTQQPY